MQTGSDIRVHVGCFTDWIAWNCYHCSNVYEIIPQDTKKHLLISQVAVIICDILIVIFHGNMAVLFICSGVASMFATASMPFSAMMMTEMTDLVLIDSGRVVNGTMAALKGFSNKAGIAISSAIVSFTLAATGYIANAIGQEPQAVITGITVAKICGSGYLWNCNYFLALVKYPITDEIRQKVRAVYEKNSMQKISSIKRNKMKLTDINIRDPYILCSGDWYYMYGTRAETCWGSGRRI